MNLYAPVVVPDSPHVFGLGEVLMHHIVVKIGGTANVVYAKLESKSGGV